MPDPPGGYPSSLMGPTTEPLVLTDRYELSELLGQGGMGEVRLAHDRRLGRQVAVKLLRRDLAANGRVRSRFEDEARAAAQLTHPNVVAVFDTGEHEGVPFIVMERLPGRTLADEIANGPLDPGRAREVAIHVLGALGAAHAAGIVHRDVKPGNVLLTDGDSVKVGDFGIAKSAEALDQTTAGTVLGTPCYVAPERLTGEPATAAADIYSVGVLLYEALSGVSPFTAPDALGVAHQVCTGGARPLQDVRPDVDAGLAAVVARAMAFNPHDRFSSAAAMAAALQPAVDDLNATGAMTGVIAPDATQALTVPPVATLPPPPTPAVPRRSSRPLAWLAVVAVLLLVGLALLLARDQGSGAPSSGSPATTAPPPSLAPNLDSAISDLESAVHP
ncbi:MAG: eukaryotic-like serine/threonine-protein kinase [Acidimicrobiaceae bacterium]